MAYAENLYCTLAAEETEATKGPRGTSGEDRRNAAGSRIRNMMPPW